MRYSNFLAEAASAAHCAAVVCSKCQPEGETITRNLAFATRRTMSVLSANSLKETLHIARHCLGC